MNRAAGNPEGAAELRCQEPELAEACRDLIQQEEEQEQDLILEHTVYTKVNTISGLKKKKKSAVRQRDQSRQVLREVRLRCHFSK